MIQSDPHGDMRSCAEMCNRHLEGWLVVLARGWK